MEIDAVLEGLSSNASDEQLLDLLSAGAAALIADDLIHRLVPHAPRLATLDYDRHPWAALPAGVAICALNRPEGRRILGHGRTQLEEVDGSSAALAWFLEGLQDLGEGNLEGATVWWRKAQASLDPQLTATRLALAHLALGAYERGSLGEATIMAEEAIWSAEQVNDVRTEAVASLYLAFFHLYTGRFACCARLIERADAALELLEPENRYELPLLDIERGALAALRGDDRASEVAFATGIENAQGQANEWYEAIGLTARAEFTAHSHPARSVVDAQAALERLEPIGESWWSHWARLALATAHLHTGSHHAGQETCRQLLTMGLNPLERGRTLLVLAEHGQRSGAPPGPARRSAEEAATLLIGAGADFWAARAFLVLARTDPGNAEFHRRKARRLAASAGPDPAWQRLLRGPGRLRIEILGAAAVAVDGSPIRFSTRAEVEVIAMLVCAGGSMRASAIGDRLWPDDDPTKVSHRVDNLMSSLRRSLLPTSRLRREGGLVELDFDADECDLTNTVAEARAVLQADLSAVDRARVGDVADRLRRGLLGSLQAPWSTLEQERLDDLADQVLRRTAT